MYYIKIFCDRLELESTVEFFEDQLIWCDDYIDYATKEIHILNTRAL